MLKTPTRKQIPRKVRILISGPPGIGKSTLALSAPDPVMIDCDRGMYRTDANLWVDTAGEDENGGISYETILADLTPENMANYETIIFDTGGKLLSLMQAWAIRKDPKYGQRDGSLSLKGYGAIGREFQRLMDYCYYELNKNIVIVFHSTEEKDGDNTKLRIKVEGQTRNNVWEFMDLGGFIEMQGNDRTIGFSNCERYFAKGTRGIKGVYKIPELTDARSNDFLTQLFAMFNSKCDDEASQAAQNRADYDSAMAAAKNIIAQANDAEGLALAQKQLSEIPHALSSQTESAALLKARGKELGYSYSSRNGWTKK